MIDDTIKNPVIVRRKFEGRTDPSKNNDPLTSKYMPSYRYAVVYERYGKQRVDCFPTKAQAENFITEMKGA